jgi:hypothetical protein
MKKPAFGLLLGAICAVLFVAAAATLLTVLSGDRANAWWEVALHYAIFGSVITVPLAVVGGMVLFLLARKLGQANRETALVAGVVLALAYPMYISAINESGLVTWWEFLFCGLAGLIGAAVFSASAGLKSRVGRV